MANKKGGRKRSEAEIKAIRRYYVQNKTPKWMKKARIDLQNMPKSTVPLIPVIVRDHRDRNGGHPHVMMDTVDDLEVSVGLTKDKFKGKNNPNYTCVGKPLGGNVVSYLHRQGTVDVPENYSAESVTGQMRPDDYNKAVIYAERAKNKYLAKKSNQSEQTDGDKKNK